jgi:hypothetical protein
MRQTAALWIAVNRLCNAGRPRAILPPRPQQASINNQSSDMPPQALTAAG